MNEKPQNRPKPRNFLGDEKGMMAVMFALLVPLFVVMAALAIDFSYAYWKRNTVQVDASVTALAGAGYISDDATATRSGIWSYDSVDKDGDGLPDDDAGGLAVLLETLYYSDQNIAASEKVLATVDVLPGNWDPDTRTFTMAGIWDPDTQVFTEAPATYDEITGTFSSAAAAIVPLNAVMTTTRRADSGPNDNPLGLFFAAAVGMSTVNINTTAIAAVAPIVGDSNSCIIALDEDGDPGLEIIGNVDLYAEDCDIQVNSCDETQAAWIKGNSEVYLGLIEGEEGSGGSLIMCGEYRETGSVIVEGTVESNQDEQDGDPVSLTPPPVGDCDYTDYTWPVLDADGNPEVLMPGVYCGGIRLTGSGGLVDPYITFCGVVSTLKCPGVLMDGTAANDAGLYIIKDGPLEFPGNAGVVGEGVTFYLTDEAGGPYSLVDFKGTTSTTIDLSAPKPEYFYEQDDSISLAGVLFWHDCGGTEDECAGLTHNLRGTAGYGMEGLLYFPDSEVYIRGTSDADGGETDCLVLVANTIKMNGETTLNVNNTCGGYGGLDDLFVADLRLRLVN